VTLYLGIAAHQTLVAYCNATGLNVPRAVRTILRQAAGARFAAGRWSAAAPPVVTELAYLPLPDLRPEVARAMMQRTDGRKYLPSVYVVMRTTVALDALARQGLVRTAVALGVTHQEAARYLLAGARPSGPGPGTGARRPVGAVSHGRPMGSPPD
jgi:hypothetical protein